MQHVITVNFHELSVSITHYAISCITTLNTGTMLLMLLIRQSTRGLIEPPQIAYVMKVCMCVHEANKNTFSDINIIT